MTNKFIIFAFAVDFLFSIGVYWILKTTVSNFAWAEGWLIGNLAFYICMNAMYMVTMQASSNENNEKEKDLESKGT